MKLSEKSSVFKTTPNSYDMTIRKIITLSSALLALLLIPLIAMQYTNEVTWTLIDFVVAAALLIGAFLAIYLTVVKINRKFHRITLTIVILTMFFLVWAELAVGIIGTPFAGS